MSDIAVIEVVTQRTITIDGPGNERTVLAATAPHYALSVATTGLQGAPGPTGSTGPAGPQGPAGPPGPVGTVTEQRFDFAVPAAVWEATHTFPIDAPDVKTFDTSGVPIYSDVYYPTASTIRIEWFWPMAGSLVVTP